MIYYQTDRCTLFQGDAGEVLSSIRSNYIDLTVTSPPYDTMRAYNGFKFNFEMIAHELYRVTKNGGVVVWVVGDETINGSETGTSFRQTLRFMDIGFNLHDTMIYKKSGFNFPSTNRYHQIFEYMFVFSKGKPKTFNPIKDRKNVHPGQLAHSYHRVKNGHVLIKGNKEVEEFGLRMNVWDYKTGGGQVTTDKFAHEHPAIFPEQLATDHIFTWTNEGDVVMDCLAGSGTTLKSALLSKRKCLGIELDKKYCKLITRRLKTIEEGND